MSLTALLECHSVEKTRSGPLRFRGPAFEIGLLSAGADRESFLETTVLICFFALEVTCVVNLLVTVV